MVVQADGSGIKPTARYYGYHGTPSGSGCVATDRITCPVWTEQSRAPHHIPHKTSPKVAERVLKLKRRLRRYGSKRLVRDYSPGCGHSAFERICREKHLMRTRKRRRERRNDLRALKARYRFGRRTCNDTKPLDDIPEYWAQAIRRGLPLFQYSHRDVRTGAMFLGFANELSGTHAAVFTRALTAWYRQHGVRLRGAVWLHDGGSEYIGSVKAKHPSAFQLALAEAASWDFRYPRRPTMPRLRRSITPSSLSSLRSNGSWTGPTSSPRPVVISCGTTASGATATGTIRARLRYSGE